MLLSRPSPPRSLPERPRSAAPRRWVRLTGWLLAAAVLAGVFAAYLQPSMALEVALLLWSCF